jgi:membrane protein involved in colicin uptake
MMKATVDKEAMDKRVTVKAVADREAADKRVAEEVAVKATVDKEVVDKRVAEEAAVKEVVVGAIRDSSAPGQAPSSVAGAKRAVTPSDSTPPAKRPYRGVWKPWFV